MVFLSCNQVTGKIRRGQAASFLCFLLIFLIMPADTPPPAWAGGPDLPWGYEGGTGPRHWGEMEHDHHKHLMCREGIHQSPVDIRQVLGVEKAQLQSRYHETPIQIIHNRHTIMLRYAPGSYLEWEKEKFELIQFHFHSPSEHLENGAAHPMELHFVHKSVDHEYVVVAVFARIGKENQTIQKLWDRIPMEIDREKVDSGEKISAADIIPHTKKYLHYTGSLTTPPCTENVTWLLAEEPIEISRAQLEYFRRFIPHNARPAQKLHHRVIVELK